MIKTCIRILNIQKRTNYEIIYRAKAFVTDLFDEI